MREPDYTDINAVARTGLARWVLGPTVDSQKGVANAVLWVSHDRKSKMYVADLAREIVPAWTITEPAPDIDTEPSVRICATQAPHYMPRQLAAFLSTAVEHLRNLLNDEDYRLTREYIPLETNRGEEAIAEARTIMTPPDARRLQWLYDPSHPDTLVAATQSAIGDYWRIQGMTQDRYALTIVRDAGPLWPRSEYPVDSPTRTLSAALTRAAWEELETRRRDMIRGRPVPLTPSRSLSGTDAREWRSADQLIEIVVRNQPTPTTTKTSAARPFTSRSARGASSLTGSAREHRPPPPPPPPPPSLKPPTPKPSRP